MAINGVSWMLIKISIGLLNGAFASERIFRTLLINRQRSFELLLLDRLIQHVLQDIAHD